MKKWRTKSSFVPQTWKKMITESDVCVLPPLCPSIDSSRAHRKYSAADRTRISPLLPLRCFSFSNRSVNPGFSPWRYCLVWWVKGWRVVMMGVGGEHLHSAPRWWAGTTGTVHEASEACKVSSFVCNILSIWCCFRRIVDKCASLLGMWLRCYGDLVHLDVLVICTPPKAYRKNRKCSYFQHITSYYVHKIRN